MSRRSHLPLNLGGGYDLPTSQLALPISSFPRVPLSAFSSQLTGRSLLYPGFAGDRSCLPPLMSSSGMLSLAATRNLLEASSRNLNYLSSALAGGGLPASLLQLSDHADTRAALSLSLRGESSTTANSHETKSTLVGGKGQLKPTTTLEVNFNPDGALLPVDFEPGQHSVIIGRTKKCYTSVGNLRLRDICLMHLPAYSKCTKKKDKSQVVSDIMQLIRESCPEGGAFIKKDGSGRWHEVRDVIARERVASIFRDFLHDQYRSSSKSKVEKRREKRINKTSDEGVVSSEEDTEDES